MNQTRCIVILSILALFVASVSVAGNISLPDASQKVFEGKPCINSPRAIGNYPASPFLFLYSYYRSAADGMECGETSERIETGFENRDYHRISSF